ncbi:hypothetical protein [Actinophytocola glycyrrhizae]|uniref:Uncharacterized protein n=1 Tax=Actinophytocola glycyrrhizae TaxID=2044873 RepID=A0ABV9SEU2_9PSEU
MLTAEALEVLSILVDLQELDSAKEAARGLLNTAPISDLWTIARCADILDTNNRAVAVAKLDQFARELTDEHRAALVHFCRDETGDRPRLTATDTPAQPDTLSVYFDTRPGYDEEGPQPAGLTVHPAPWEQARARRMAELSRQLRTAKNQLPAHVRSEMRAVRSTDPTCRRPVKSRAQHKAERLTDDYMRTRLGIEDHSAPPNARRTVFDIDDDQPTTPASDQPDAYALDYDRAARPQLWATPCVWCFVERRPQDDRATRSATRHDDGLCVECRDANRPGLPLRTQPTRRPVRAARTVAYINPQARAIAARSAEITAPCAAVAEHLPPAAALVWMRAYYRMSPEAHHPIIEQWVTAWRDAQRPQPPTPITPAAPVPALAAA